VSEPIATEGPAGAADTAPAATAHIGWPRAVLSGLAILVVGFGAAVGGANYVLTGFNGGSRDTKVYLASAWFLVVVVVMAWGLRRLQARGSI
jgi:hypothetical protein